MLLRWQDGFLATAFWFCPEWWERVGNGSLEGDFSIAAAQSQAIGARTLMFSTDGEEWTELALQPPAGRATVERAAVFDGRLVIAGVGERSYPPATREDLIVAVTDDLQTWSTSTIPLSEPARGLPSTVAVQMYAGTLTADADGWALETSSAFDVVPEEVVPGTASGDPVYVSMMSELGFELTFEEEGDAVQPGTRWYAWHEVGVSSEQLELFHTQGVSTWWSATWGGEPVVIAPEEPSGRPSLDPAASPDPSQGMWPLIWLDDGVIVALVGLSPTTLYRVDETGTEWTELDLPGLPTYLGAGSGMWTTPRLAFDVFEDLERPEDGNDRDAPAPDNFYLALVDDDLWVVDTFGPGRATVNAAVNGDTLLTVVGEDWYRYDVSE